MQDTIAPYSLVRLIAGTHYQGICKFMTDKERSRRPEGRLAFLVLSPRPAVMVIVHHVHLALDDVCPAYMKVLDQVSSNNRLAWTQLQTRKAPLSRITSDENISKILLVSIFFHRSARTDQWAEARTRDIFPIPISP